MQWEADHVGVGEDGGHGARDHHAQRRAASPQEGHGGM
jgi:hypothetical protein